MKKLVIIVLSVLLFPSMTSADSFPHKPGQLIAREGTVYLIQSGERLGFPSADVFTSHGYTFDMVLPATDADMALQQGENLKFRANTLVLDTADGRTMYLIFDDGAHPIPSMTEMVFINGDGRVYYVADLSSYPKASPVGLGMVYANHPSGSLVNISGAIYLITPQGRRLFPSVEVFASYGHSFEYVFPYTVLDESLPVLSAMPYRDGTLVNDNGTIFLVSQGKKHGFKTWAGFLFAGYSLSAVIAGTTAGYPEGESFE